MRVIIFVITILFLEDISAQPGKTYIVRAGEVPSEVLPADAIYVFPNFKQGTVYMRDGSISTTRLNYNVILNEMQFIADKGDTLAIAYPETIKKIFIDTLLFVYDKTYLQIFSQIDSFKIALKQSFIQMPYRTRGGYDTPTGAGAITTYSSISSSGTNAKLQVRKDVQFEKQVAYFISDQFNHYIKADKKAFLNIFQAKKSIIQNYMNENNIDYSKVSDVEKLLKFCVLQH